MKQHRHPSRVFGGALSAAVLIAALLLAAAPAWRAERDAALAPGAPIAAPDAGATPAAPPPAQATGALAGQQTAVAGRLAARLAGAGESLDVAGQSLPAALLRDSYATAGYGPIWTEDSGIAPAGVVLIDQLQSAKSAGMTMIDPLLAAIADHAGAKTPDELADLDLLLSAALLAATADSGDSPPADLLAGARKGDPRAFVATHLPGTFFYWGLRQALPAYRQYAAGPAWPTVPSGPKLEKGMTDPRVAALRARLTATGELAAAEAVSDPQVFDDTLAAALRKFQASHGLDSDGKVGPQTVAALCFGPGPAELDPAQYGALPPALAQHGRALSLCECRRDGAVPGRAGTGDLSQPRDRRTGGPQDAAAAKRDQAHRLQSDLGRTGEDRAHRR
jgi:murein L,D-transpeptidase YcbB/YkuD